MADRSPDRSPDRYQLVFAGELLPGFTAGIVQRALAEQLKLDEARIERLFSGEPVVLKHDVDLVRARRYVERFEAMGARLRIERAPPPKAPRPAAAAPPAYARMNAQRKAPATPMPPGTAGLSVPTLTTAVAPRVAPAPRPSSARAGRRGSSTGSSLWSGLWGWGLQGRMARLPYALATVFSLGAAALLTLLVAAQPSAPRLAFAALGFIVLIALSLRWTVLRCHDLDRSGWWALATAVPYVGIVAGLALWVLPGSAGPNDYGDPPGR